MWLLGWLTFVTLNQEPHNPIGGASLLRFNEKAQCLGPAYSCQLSVHISLGCSNALKEEHRYTHAHTLESMLLLIVCSKHLLRLLWCAERALLHACRHLGIQVYYVSVWPHFLRLLRCAEQIFEIHSFGSHFLIPIQFSNVYTAYISCLSTQGGVWICSENLTYIFTRFQIRPRMHTQTTKAFMHDSRMLIHIIASHMNCMKAGFAELCTMLMR